MARQCVLHADGPALEKARFPNLVLVRGTEKSDNDGRIPERDCVAIVARCSPDTLDSVR